jgi:hypothetical protein
MKRWLKRLFGIDPLVGMYVLNGYCVGRVLSRIRTHEGLSYLVRYSWRDEAGREGNVWNECSIQNVATGGLGFFASRKQAERRRDWLVEFHKKSGRRQWEPPQPIKEMPDAG